MEPTIKQILWADDEIQLLQPYILFLRDKGYEVTPVCSGQDAIDAFEEDSFDIVFLDEQMPGMSGIETLQELKRLHPETPVVMITKSEEENIMEQAIGQQIADYLIKPVNPNQILLCLKKHIQSRQLVAEQTNKSYREEFTDIAYMIDTARTFDEFVSIHKSLNRWDLQLQDVQSSMRDMLLQQREQANTAWAKWIIRNYESWFTGNTTDRPLLSPDIFKRKIFPLLDEGQKVFLIVIDNFRYDQWKTIQPLLNEIFSIDEEQIYCSILPTATQYARNAIFAGLMPEQIRQMHPDLWVAEEEEEGKNLNEKELIQNQLDRFRKRYGFTSKMMRELCNNESAYRALTLSWFQHSPTKAFLERIARLGYKVVLTTDHGTVRVTNPVPIVGDKNTNTNLRYKEGKALACQSKNVYEVKQPLKVGLPCPNVSTSYVFCTGNDFFGYPNNFNYYAQIYRNTFQHGGISMEEMLIPLITMSPK